MIEELYIDNYKAYRDFRLKLNPDLNIIVGDNESGKSTILEAVNLALTCKLNGRSLTSELSPFLFNETAVNDYLLGIQAKSNPIPPRILIELYVKDEAALARFRGGNNSLKEDRVGFRIEVVLDSDYKEEYESLITSGVPLVTIPIEYYKVSWQSFANGSMTGRSMPVGASFVDATTIRLQTGTDYYLQNAISDSLVPKERASLALAYRGLKEDFSKKPAIASINTRLAKYKSIISERLLNVSIDISQRAGWESSLIPYLASLPFQYIGRGEQAIIKTLVALEKSQEKDQIILLEEPETHLSFSSLSQLISTIAVEGVGRQIILTTHSPFVLNKLGLDRLILIASGDHTTLASLPPDTQDYFKKLPGFDTLRLVLAKRSILVEGPSDELIVQRAHMDSHNGVMPQERGIDVISARGLSFKRFLDIASLLPALVLDVVTDNDGDFDTNVVKKYDAYKTHISIRLRASGDNARNNIESQLVGSNGVDSLNAVFKTKHKSEAELLHWMEKHKTEYAVRLFESPKAITYPQHILDAIKD